MNSTGLSTASPSNISITTAVPCAAELLSNHPSAKFYVIPSAILGTLIMALNLLVVIAVVKNKKLQKPAFYYVCSLAVADFIAGFMLIFSFLRGFFSGNVTREELIIKQGIFIVSVSASIFTLFLICLNRYFVIIHPFHYRAKMNNIIVAVAIATIWVYSMIGGSLPIAGWNAMNYGCSGIFPGLARTYIFVVGLHVVIILVIIMVLYLRIFCKVRESSRNFRIGARSSEDKAHIKVAKTLFIVTAAFAVCWLPYMMVCILDFTHSIKLAKYTPFFALLAVLNSGLNPLIYAWRDVEMRKTFKSILCPCACCHRPAQDTLESSNVSTHSTIFSLCYGSPVAANDDEGQYEAGRKAGNSPKGDSIESKPLAGDNN